MKENDFAINIKNVSKNYKISGRKLDFDAALFSAIGRYFKDLLVINKNTIAARKANSSFPALSNITLKISHGEKIGIIGRNGAGKSTLLKILSRITYPDKGRVEIYGRVASLLEIGTGFHPDLSGRENIYLNGTLLGMSRKEVDQNLEEIIGFSGITTFLDTPIKKYSSGMKVRLAFAVAAHLTSEIVIVDEVLAVGDVVFQQKCVGKMNEIARAGRTIIFVSHNMSAIRNLCERVIYLKNGRVICDGETDVAIKQYLSENISDEVTIDRIQLGSIEERIPANAMRTMALTDVKILSSDGKQKNEFGSDEEIHINLGIEAIRDVYDMRVVVSVVDEDNNNIFTSQASDTELISKLSEKTVPGNYSATCIIPADFLGNNKYYLTINLIHPFVEQQVYNKVLSFKVIFKGYNNVQLYSFGNAYLRPKLQWQFYEGKPGMEKEDIYFQ